MKQRDTDILHYVVILGTPTRVLSRGGERGKGGGASPKQPSFPPKRDKNSTLLKTKSLWI